MRVAVVVVNWNGWADTLECLESLLRSRPGGATVVVCDNGSTDGSPERIRDWAEGRLCAWTAPDNPLRPLSHPPVPKPVPWAELGAEEAARGGGPEESPPLVLVRVGENRGFAAGVNAGLRYVLARGEHDAVWLLNNDTVVHPDALRHLVAELRRSPDAAMVGSTLLYYDRPDRVQALCGGTYNRWLALPRHVGVMSPAASLPAADEVVPRLAFVTAASMLVPRRFVEEAGLLDEGYFAYFEELDWIGRAGEGRSLAWAAESVVYHREGASFGNGHGLSGRSPVAERHFMRNRLRFTRRFAPAAVPTVIFALCVAALRRAAVGEWRRAGAILRLCLGR